MDIGTEIAVEAAVERWEVIVEIKKEENSDNDSNIDNNDDGECFHVIYVRYGLVNLTLVNVR